MHVLSLSADPSPPALAIPTLRLVRGNGEEVPAFLLLRGSDESVPAFRRIVTVADARTTEMGDVCIRPRGVPTAPLQTVSPLRLVPYEGTHGAEAGVEKWGPTFVCGFTKQAIDDPERIAQETASLERVLASDVAEFGGPADTADGKEASAAASVRGVGEGGGGAA